MATLQVNLNCMCLIVPDPAQPGGDRGTVHVLMPCTHHAGAGNLHVAQMDYTDTQGARRVVRLEGWGLELGDPSAPAAEVALRLPNGKPHNVVDITEFTRGNGHRNGRLVPRTMLTGKHPDVIARISFHGGMIEDTDAQWPDWVLRGSRVRMAHNFTWRMEVDEGQMKWTPFNGATQPPLASLAQVEAVGAKKVRTLNVHHVASKAIDSQTGLPLPYALNPDDIRNHFRMFYELLGEEPSDDQLPTLHPEDQAIINHPEYGGVAGWGCKVGLAHAER